MVTSYGNIDFLPLRTGVSLSPFQSWWNHDQSKWPYETFWKSATSLWRHLMSGSFLELLKIISFSYGFVSLELLLRVHDGVGNCSRVRPICRETELTQRDQILMTVWATWSSHAWSPLQSFQLEMSMISFPPSLKTTSSWVSVTCIRRFMMDMNVCQSSWQHRVYKPSFQELFCAIKSTRLLLILLP